MTEKERFFHNLLLDLHLCRWTGDRERVGAILENIGAYSYAHTNSNIDDPENKEEQAYKQLVERHNKIMLPKS